MACAVAWCPCVCPSIRHVYVFCQRINVINCLKTSMPSSADYSRLQYTPELDDATTSRPFCGSCTGCLFVSVLSTRSHAWYISRWLARLHHTSPTTSNSLPTAIAVSCVLPPPGRASSHGPTTTSVTAASLQQAHACGTGCRCIYDRTRTTHASSAN